jgi:hypothetical protein
VCGENLCEDFVCDDEDACTQGTCDYVDGTCAFTPVVCDDGNECTEDRCDPVDECVFTAVEDGTWCYNTMGAAVCLAGECVFAVCDQGLCEADAERKAQCEELMPAFLTDCENDNWYEDECIRLALSLFCNK